MATVTAIGVLGYGVRWVQTADASLSVQPNRSTSVAAVLQTLLGQWLRTEKSIEDLGAIDGKERPYRRPGQRPGIRQQHRARNGLSHQFLSLEDATPETNNHQGSSQFSGRGDRVLA